MATKDSVREASDKIRVWREKPHIFVREVFGVTPDRWQDEVLEAFPTQRRIAMPASKGPGKTATLAWLAWNFLSTRLHPKIAATSITARNLEDGLWTEMAKWQQKAPFLQAEFEWQKTRIFFKKFPETWWMSARTWSRNATVSEQADTLAGLHADSILFLLDETGGMPDAVMSAASAALSTGGDAHIVQAGNTTNREGPLFRACTVEKDLWKVVRINGDPDDPMRSSRVDIEWAREQIAMHGRDDPMVMVNVLGLFPPYSLNALIGPDEVAAAMRRSHREDTIRHAAKILGVDVARFGGDSSVIFPRQGLVAFSPQVFRNLDTMAGASQVGRKIIEWEADATFIDETGGYGAGWIDAMRSVGHSPIGVLFNGKPNDQQYFNKRAEIYFELVQWIKDGGQVPDIPEITKALTGMFYTFKGDRLLLEDKDQLKTRIGFSCDHTDALAITFAEPVMAKGQVARRGGMRHRHEYDPYSMERFEREYMN